MTVKLPPSFPLYRPALQQQQTRIVRMPLPAASSALQADGFQPAARARPVELGDPMSSGRQFLRQLENALRFGYLSTTQGEELAQALVHEGMTQSLSMRLDAQLSPAMANPISRLVNLTERIASGKLSSPELASAQREVRALQRQLSPEEPQPLV